MFKSKTPLKQLNLEVVMDLYFNPEAKTIIGYKGLAITRNPKIPSNEVHLVNRFPCDNGSVFVFSFESLNAETLAQFVSFYNIDMAYEHISIEANEETLKPLVEELISKNLINKEYDRI